ncbi:porin [Paraburkholderia xenovorans]|nr:porin [Paraburkholderia xenovorans]
MKTKLMPLVAAVLTAITGTAHAQSSVTLYGLIDEGVLYNTNAKGGHQYAITNSTAQGDRWGLIGREDLGGGLQAIFRLENGFNIETGALEQGGAEFGRQAYVGFAGKFGQVTFGRHYDPIVDSVSGYILAGSTHQGGAGQVGGVFSSHPGDMDNLDNSYRVNNSIKYYSPVFDGFQSVALYSVGGVAGDYSRNQIWALSASYNSGSFSAGAAFEKINEPNFSLFGNNPSSSATGNNMAATPVYSGYASAKSQQIATAGASYAVGAFSIAAIYSNVRFSDLGSVGGGVLNPNNLSGTAVFNTGELNVGYRITSSWMVGLGYTYTQGTSFDSLPAAKYKQINIGTDYILSKRTDLFAMCSYQRASGYDSTLKPAVASIYTATPSASNTQLVATVGIRTKF